MPARGVDAPEEVGLSSGCLGFVALIVTLALLRAVLAPITWLAALMIAGAVALALFVLGRTMDVERGARELMSQGKIGLLVWSDSPVWKPYIEAEWLPRFGSRVAMLNWSHRRRWDSKDPLVRFYRGCMNSYANVNPVVILVRPGRPPLLFRFYPAFRNAKHGNRAGLEMLEKELFACVSS